MRPKYEGVAKHSQCFHLPVVSLFSGLGPFPSRSTAMGMNSEPRARQNCCNSNVVKCEVCVREGVDVETDFIAPCARVC